MYVYLWIDEYNAIDTICFRVINVYLLKALIEQKLYYKITYQKMFDKYFIRPIL